MAAALSTINRTDTAGWQLEQRYLQLPALFYRPARPTPATQPRLVALNRPLATELGLDPEALAAPAHAGWWTGNDLPPGAQPLALAYAGHQYGHFTGLGDGRALLLGEQRTPAGDLREVQWKGAGPTPFSRGGDGRAALGPMLREFLVSEAMHALGLPTTRMLAVATTGQTVLRPPALLPGAVLTRIAASHVRVGTFEWAAAQGEEQALRALVAFTIERHYPAAAAAASPVAALLEAAAERQARLVAQWMHVGFVHGVMNTDNVALSGETLDYGPCAFLDRYDPATVFSSIDRHGRYAYGQQPAVARWNLARWAETLLPLLHPREEEALALANAALDRFRRQQEDAWLEGMRAKLGLGTAEPGDAALATDLLDWMQRQQADFTLTFVRLTEYEPGQPPPFADDAFAAWHQRWQERLGRETSPAGAARAGAAPTETPRQRMRRHNPVVIPRNHLVEEALTAAVEQQDYAPFERLLAEVRQPFRPAAAVSPRYTQPAPADLPPYRTFCGT